MFLGVIRFHRQRCLYDSSRKVSARKCTALTYAHLFHTNQKQNHTRTSRTVRRTARLVGLALAVRRSSRSRSPLHEVAHPLTSKLNTRPVSHMPSWDIPARPPASALLRALARLSGALAPIRVSTDHMHTMACNWGGNWWQSSGTGLELPVPQTPKVHPHRRPHTCQLPAASAQNAKEDEGAQNKILPVRRPPVPPSTALPPQSCAKAAVFWRSSMSSCCSFFLSAAPAPSVIASAVSALVE